MDEFNVASFADAPSAPEIKTYKAIAIRGIVVFPAQTVHFEIGRDKSLAAVERGKTYGYGNSSDKLGYESEFDKILRL